MLYLLGDVDQTLETVAQQLAFAAPQQLSSWLVRMPKHVQHTISLLLMSARSCSVRNCMWCAQEQRCSNLRKLLNFHVHVLGWRTIIRNDSEISNNSTLFYGMRSSYCLGLAQTSLPAQPLFLYCCEEFTLSSLIPCLPSSLCDHIARFLCVRALRLKSILFQPLWYGLTRPHGHLSQVQSGCLVQQPG